MESSKLYEALTAGNQEQAMQLLTEAGDQPDFTARTSCGQTLLHMAAQKLRSVEVLQCLLGKVDFTVRDEDSNTAVDLVFENEEYPVEVETVIQEVVRQRILGSEKSELETMLYSGWLDLWLKEGESVENDKVDLQQFLQSLPKKKACIEKLHSAIQCSELDEVKAALEADQSLVGAADRTGFPPLHKATILAETEIVQHLTQAFPDSLKTTDHMGRTALHHAAGRRDGGHLYQLLVDAGAQVDIKDMNGRTPTEINEDPDLLPGEKTALTLAAKLAKPVLVRRVEKKQEQQQTETQTPDNTEQPEQEQATASKPGTPAESQPAVPQKPKEDQPIQMYISPDVRPNPPPDTIDGRYVAEHLGHALTLALAEISDHRPWDPIEYLANWLYKYQENISFNKRQEELLGEIRAEEAARVQEKKVREERRDELQRLQQEERRKQQAAEEERKRREQEEMQRKAKEAALSQQPGLETVMEAKEEDEAPKEKSHKDSRGQTELHKLASQQAADLTTLLNMGYSPADRDADNHTARDIAETAGIRDNVEAIDKYVQKLVEMEEFDSVEDLLLAGYDKFDVVQQRLTQQNTTLPDSTQTFLNNLPQLQGKITAMFTAVQTEGVSGLTSALDQGRLATARDHNGRSPLHIAVLVGHREAVEHLATNYPDSMKCKDNLERTPLHYAMAVSEEMTALLEKHGADSLAKDVKNQTPSFYKSCPDEIVAIKVSLKSVYTGTQDNSSAQEPETTENREPVTQEDTQQQQE